MTMGHHMKSRRDASDESPTRSVSRMLGISVLAIVAGLLAVTGMIGPAAIPIWGAVAVFGWLTSRGPVGQAIADRLRGGPPHAEFGEVPEEIYAELDDLRTRMLEMEERQEFSERLLAQKQPASGAEGGVPDDGS
ncbi:MAG TPA: hypothetical protein VFN22_10865 [Gemmatimonadales bacterium]|nr:hypothetical protein [Gemmatimonadales bacterium]